MGEIIAFPGPDKKRRARPETDGLLPFGSVRSTPTSRQLFQNARLHKTAFDLADDIGKAFKFWFVIQSVPDDEHVFGATLQKFASCLSAIAAERGAQSLRQLGGVYVDLAGRKLIWQKSETGQTILSAPVQVDTSALRRIILDALSNGPH
jgi:hypothetical protein